MTQDEQGVTERLHMLRHLDADVPQIQVVVVTLISELSAAFYQSDCLLRDVTEVEKSPNGISCPEVDSHVFNSNCEIVKRQEIIHLDINVTANCPNLNPHPEVTVGRASSSLSVQFICDEGAQDAFKAPEDNLRKKDRK